MTRRLTILALSAIFAFGIFGNPFRAVKFGRRSGYIVASS
jgi:hypothetical protein